MAITKTLIKNGAKGHHRFALTVNEDTTSGNNSIMSFNFTLSALQQGWDWADWGSKISFQIKIGDNTYTGTIPQYDGHSTVTLKSVNNISIPHDSDGTKTIDISFSVTDSTGTDYTCGDASANSKMELSVLHKGPELTNVAFTELNTLLTGISANQVVNDLSKVKLTLTVKTYDGATITNYSVRNGNYEVKGTSNVITMDFQTNKMVIVSENGINKCNYVVKLVDNKSATREFMVSQDVILYFKPNLIPTASSIKRNGQVSGKVNLNLTGTFYNSTILSKKNNISLSFKYWQSGTTEPTTYYSIPTSAITISNNNISINKWNMAKNGAVITDVNKSSSYKFKIKAIDSFNSTSEIELTCSKGEWLIAKFKDRVDFKRITQGGVDVATVINITDKLKATNEYRNGKMVYKIEFIGQMPSTVNVNSNAVLKTLNFDFTQAWIDESLSYISNESETLPTTFYYSPNDYLRIWINKNSGNKHIRIRNALDLSAYTYHIVVACHID